MIFFPLLFSFLSFAHIIQDDVSVLERTRFSLKEVCTKSGYSDSPLIDVVSGALIDCMGRKVDVTNFCDRELAHDPYYLRAYIEKEEVVCLTGKRVLFKYQCVKFTDRDLCSKEAQRSCEIIKRKLARRLDLIHSSFVKNEKGIKQLNCFFESTPRERYGL